MEFFYFQAGTNEMSGFLPSGTCVFCRAQGPVFELEYPDDGKHGCGRCLKQGRFGFSHDTDFGYLTREGLSGWVREGDIYRREDRVVEVSAVGTDGGVSPPVAVTRPGDGPTLPAPSVEGLHHTPKFRAWQTPRWLCHCDDFMQYQGPWEPHHFEVHGGRDFFYDHVDEDYVPLELFWPEDGNDSDGQCHMFKCLKCGEYRGFLETT